MYDLYKEHVLTDFQIVSGEATFDIHRVAFYMHGGEYFRTLLMSSYKEVQSSRIDLSDFAPDVVSLYIDCVYRGFDNWEFESEIEIQKLSLEDVIILYSLCMYLSNDELGKIVLRYVYKNTSIYDIPLLISYSVYPEIGNLFKDHFIVNVVGSVKKLKEIWMFCF